MTHGFWPVVCGAITVVCIRIRGAMHLAEPDICLPSVAVRKPRGLRSTVNAVLPNAGWS